MTQALHHDLDELRQQKLAVPATFTRGAWITRSLTGDAPGPGGTQLLLWLPVDAAGWPAVDAAIGARGGASSRTVPGAARALWDGGDGPEVTGSDPLTVVGAEYPATAFGNLFWKHGWVLGTRAGLLISLVNG